MVRTVFSLLSVVGGVALGVAAVSGVASASSAAGVSATSATEQTATAPVAPVAGPTAASPSGVSGLASLLPTGVAPSMIPGLPSLPLPPAAAAAAAAAASAAAEYPSFLQVLARQADTAKAMEHIGQSLFHAAMQNEGAKMMENAINSVVPAAVMQNLFNEAANRGAKTFFGPFESLFGTIPYQARSSGEAVAEGNAEGATAVEGKEAVPQRVLPILFPFGGALSQTFAATAAAKGPRYEFHDHIYECGGRPCDQSSDSHSVSREE